MHRWAAHLMVITVFLHMARVFYHGAYKPPREFNWVIGVILLTLTLLLSFTGYLLPWDQLALWAVTVGTNMMGYTPVFGSQVRFVLLGGVEIGTETLLRWYVLHVLHVPVRDRDLHGHPLLACPQGRRHLGARCEARRRPTALRPREGRRAARSRLRGVQRPAAIGGWDGSPEHLLRRSAERRAALGAACRRRPPRPSAPADARAPTTAEKIPAHLLARSAGQGGGGRGHAGHHRRRGHRGGGHRGRHRAGARRPRAPRATPSGCSPSSRPGRSRTSRPPPPTRCTSGPTCSRRVRRLPWP